MRFRLPRATRLASAAALPLVFMAAQPVADGMSYEFVMTTTSKQTGNKETVTLRGRGVYAGDDAKIEIPSMAGAPGSQNAGNSNFAVDSIGGAATEGAKEGAKKEAKDIGKEAAAGAASKLKGVFGGKKPKPE